MKTIKKIQISCALLAAAFNLTVAQTGPYGVKFEDRVVADGVTYNVYSQNGTYGQDEKYVAFVGAPADGSKYKGDIVLVGEIEYNGEVVNVKGIIAQQPQNQDTPAFYDTPELNSVTLAENMYMLRSLPFKNSGIRKIVFPQEYFLWLFEIFQDCPNLTDIHLNSKLTELGGNDSAAGIPEGTSVTLYFDGAVECHGFWGASAIQFDNEPLYLYNYGFCNAPLNETEGLKLPAKTVVHQFGLGRTEAKWIEFPVAEPVEEVSYVYNGDVCTLPAREERIGIYAFNEAENLERIICRDPKPWQAHEKAFMFDKSSPGDMTLYNKCTLYVPAEAIDTYKADAVWGKFAQILPIEDGVNEITTDENGGAVEYFDMQGRRLDNPRPGTLVIRRQGTTVTKLRMEN